MIDDNLNLRLLKKMKVQKLSDADIEKRLQRSKHLLTLYTRKVLETAFFTDEKIFKVNQLYNAQNDRVYAPKDQLKRDVAEERLCRETSAFPK